MTTSVTTDAARLRAPRKQSMSASLVATWKSVAVDHFGVRRTARREWLFEGHRAIRCTPLSPTWETPPAIADATDPPDHDSNRPEG